jgi:hypothetical protein
MEEAIAILPEIISAAETFKHGLSFAQEAFPQVKSLGREIYRMIFGHGEKPTLKGPPGGPPIAEVTTVTRPSSFRLGSSRASAIKRTAGRRGRRGGGQGGTANMVGKDFVQEVGTTSGGIGEVLVSLDLAPGSFNGSRLEVIANVFEEYFPKVIRFHYEPAVPTTTAGQLLMVAIPDPTSRPTQGESIDYREIAAQFQSRVKKVWEADDCSLPISAGQNMRYVTAGEDVRLSSPGQFLLVRGPGCPDNTSLGAVYMTYEYDFSVASMLRTGQADQVTTHVDVTTAAGVVTAWEEQTLFVSGGQAPFGTSAIPGATVFVTASDFGQVSIIPAAPLIGAVLEFSYVGVGSDTDYIALDPAAVSINDLEWMDDNNLPPNSYDFMLAQGATAGKSEFLAWGQYIITGPNPFIEIDTSLTLAGTATHEVTISAVQLSGTFNTAGILARKCVTRALEKLGCSVVYTNRKRPSHLVKACVQEEKKSVSDLEPAEQSVRTIPQTPTRFSRGPVRRELVAPARAAARIDEGYVAVKR